MNIRQLISRFLWFEPFWVLLLGIPIMLPGKFFSLVWQPYLIIALFIYWPLRWYMHWCTPSIKPNLISYYPPFCSPLGIPILIMLLGLPINLWASVDKSTSWIAIGYFLFGVTLFTAIIRWPPTQHRPEWVAWLLVLCGSSLALISPPFVVWKPEFRLFHLPLYAKLQSIHFDIGETIHANVLAGVLVIILPILLVFVLQKSTVTPVGYREVAKSQTPIPKLPSRSTKRVYLSSIVSRILVMAVFVLIFGILVVTQSRGGYLAVSIAMLFVFMLKWPRLFYTIPLGLVIIALIIHQLGIQSLLDHLSTDGSLGGWDGRIDIWTQSFSALNDFALTGIGIGTFTQIIPLLYPLRVSIEGYPHAHNLFLQIGVDLGLLGLIAYLALLINLFAMLTTVLRARHATALQRTLAIGATGSLTAMLVHGLLDAVTWGTKLAFIPWLLFAFITLLFLEVEKERMPVSNT